MQINDRIIGLLAILGGIGIYAGTFGFRSIPGQQYGSAFFPRVLAIVLVIAGVLMLFTAVRGKLVTIGEMLKGSSGLKVLAVLVSVVVWVYLSPLVGFIATTAFLIAALAIVAGGSPLPSIATGIGMSIILFFVFGQLLRVPLPLSAIERLLS
ncbi:MAG: hypothetical protein CME90_05210 [Hoeflea sp.]|nr:hypothetical protein [Hoeflea sp.]|tara:strand:- start:1771 stop:2229 length:459 start_codon:yes stop_codon:yes gene_type:complete